MRVVVAGVAALALAVGCGSSSGPPDATQAPDGEATEHTIVDAADPEAETPEH